MKKAHLLRCAQPPRFNVLSKVGLRSSVNRAPCIWSFLIVLRNCSKIKTRLFAQEFFQTLNDLRRLVNNLLGQRRKFFAVHRFYQPLAFFCLALKFWV